MATVINQNTSAKSHNTEILKWIITFLVPVIVWLIPMPVDQNVRLFLMVTFWAVTSWITCVIPVEVTGMLIPTSLLLLNVADASVVFSPWANTVVWASIALILLGNAASASGLSTRMAYSILIRLNTSFKGLIWGFSIAGLFLSFILTDNFVRTIVFLTIAIGICKALGIEAKSKEATALTLAAFFGMAGPSIGTMPAGTGIQVNSVFHGSTGMYITYGQWLLHNMLPSIAWTIAGVLAILKVLKIENVKNFDAKAELAKKHAELGEMTRREKFTLLFLLLVVMDYIGATRFGLDPLLIPIFFIPFMFLPGVNALTMDDFKIADFKILFVMTGALCIGAVAGHVGLIDMLIEILTPLIAGSGVRMVIGTFIFGTIAHFLMTPLGLVFTFGPLFFQMAQTAGINPMPVAYALNFSTDIYVFPFQYAALLIAFGFGYTGYKDAIKVLLVRALLGYVVFGLIAVPFWKLLGLL